MGPVNTIPRPILSGPTMKRPAPSWYDSFALAEPSTRMTEQVAETDTSEMSLGEFCTSHMAFG